VKLVLPASGRLAYQGLVVAAGIGKEQAAHKVFGTVCLNEVVVKE